MKHRPLGCVTFGKGFELCPDIVNLFTPNHCVDSPLRARDTEFLHRLFAYV